MKDLMSPGPGTYEVVQDAYTDKVIFLYQALIAAKDSEGYTIMEIPK